MVAFFCFRNKQLSLSCIS